MSVLVACAAPNGSTASSSDTEPVEAVAPSAVSSPTGQPTGTAAPGSIAPALPDCTGGELPTVTDGVLTVGTVEASTEPWYIGDPASGQGLESAVAAGVAGVLGYQSDRVRWIPIDPARAMTGTQTGFDIALDRFVAPEQPSAVDYSTGYFPVTTAVVMRAGSGTPSLADLGGLTLGAVAQGSDPAASAPMVVTPAAYPGASDALTALTSGSLDGVLLPIDDALAAVQADPALAVVGQLPADPQVQPEQFRALLPRGSALTGCVSAAIDRLRVEGTLDALAAQWVTPLAPVLR